MADSEFRPFSSLFVSFSRKPWKFRGKGGSLYCCPISTAGEEEKGEETTKISIYFSFDFSLSLSLNFTKENKIREKGRKRVEELLLLLLLSLSLTLSLPLSRSGRGINEENFKAQNAKQKPFLFLSAENLHTDACDCFVIGIGQLFFFFFFI